MKVAVGCQNVSLCKWFFLATQIFICVYKCEFAYLLALHPQKHKGEEFTLLCSFKLVESTTSGHQPHCTSHQLNTAVICPCGTVVHSLLAMEIQCTVAHPTSSPYHTDSIIVTHTCTYPAMHLSPHLVTHSAQQGFSLTRPSSVFNVTATTSLQLGEGSFNSWEHIGTKKKAACFCNTRYRNRCTKYNQ